MPTEILAANLGHQRLTGASKGVALSTTPAFTPFIRGTEHVTLLPRNFSTAVVARYALCPYLVILKADSSTDLAGPIADYSAIAQDGSTGTEVAVGGSGGLAAGRNFYIGSAIPFRGVSVDIDTANASNSATVTVYYWAGSWVDVSATDATRTSHAFDTDNKTVTWTVPSAWQSASLVKIDRSVNSALHWRDVSMYWTKWTWSAAIDAGTTLDHMLGINESTAYAEVSTGVATEGRVNHGFGTTGVGGVEALTDAGTANLLVNCAALNGYFSTAVVEST